MRKMWLIAVIAVLATGMFGGSAGAFQDVGGKTGEAVMALKERGIVHGLDGWRFDPGRDITLAEAVSMIVKGLLPSSDGDSDSKSAVDKSSGNDAWYAGSFAAAASAGLPIPANGNPGAAVSTLQFQEWVRAAVSVSVPGFKWPDEKLNLPKEAILTRGEAAERLYEAIRLVEEQTQKPSSSPGRYADVNGLHMYYEIHGSGGQPLILLHGAYMSIDTAFSALIPDLAADRTVIAVEFQGHGRTADIDRPITVQQLADDVSELLRQLDMQKVDVFGYSLGGAVGLQLAIRHPDAVRKLAVASVNYTSEGTYPEVAAFMDQVTPEMFAETPVVEEYNRLSPNPEAFPDLVRKLSEMNMIRQDWTDQVKQIKVPVLTMIGDSDNVRLEHAMEMFRMLGGGVAGDLGGMPASQLAIFPGTTHYTMIMQTGLLLDTLKPFLDQ